MADRKVLVLRELENLKGSCDTLTEYCRNPSQSSIVLIIHNTHNELGRRNRQPRGYGRLEKAVEANGKVYQFKKLSEKDTVRWIRQRCRKMDMTISADAAAAMMRSIGDNLYNIMNELKKIHIVYEGEEVGMEDIEKIIGRYRLNAVFDLNDSLIPGNERESLKILLRILNSGAENPSVLIYNLIRHFLDLLKIKSGYRAGGYWYRKLKKQADSFDRREILLWLENLRVADLDIKSSLLPDEAVIINCFMNSINGKLYGKTGKHFVMRAG
jgi:DNA polymerase III delta subunit